MNRNDIVSIGRVVGAYLKILWRGFTRMIVGTAVAGAMVLSIYGYAMIPTEGGYTAVSEFLIATALMVTALVCMYAMGGKAKAVRR